MNPTKQDVEDVVNHYTDLIPKLYGFDLIWSEKAALKHYYSSFANHSNQRSDIYPQRDALELFMLDYFGLPFMELHETEQWHYDESKRKLVGYTYGMNLLNNEKFKEYCRRHISEWRDERCLI